jgi:parallel beta-helix repeat protein
MSDFQPFNAATHPIVKLEDDYNNILKEAFEKTASYIVRKNGSYYEAIQGGGSMGAGTIAFGGANNAPPADPVDGTDISAVIQAAVDNAAEGRIFIKKGTYTLKTPITVRSNLIIEGEGTENTVITQGTNENLSAFFTEVAAAQKNFFVLKDLTCDGNKANNTHGRAFYGVNISDSYFEYLNLVKFADETILLEEDSLNNRIIFNRIAEGDVTMVKLDGTTGLARWNMLFGNEIEQGEASYVHIVNGRDNSISYNILMKGAGAYAFAGAAIIIEKEPGAFEGAGYNNEVAHNMIDQPQGAGTGDCVRLITADHTKIQSNTLYGGVRSGIYLDDSTYTLITENSILSNGTGILEVGTSDASFIQGNAILDNTTQVTLIGAATRIMNNRGFVTENYGVAVGASPITVAHGLSGIPDVVCLTGRSATALKTSWLANGANNIDIYHDGVGAEDISWYAFYKVV